MKQTVNKSSFIDAFASYGRAEKFSHSALEVLFEWLEQREQDTGEETELDVIAICCEWTEYETALEAAEDLGVYEYDQSETDADDKEEDALEALRDRTTVLEVPGGGVLVQQF